MDDQRFVGLESKLAYQEQTADQLGEVLRGQQEQIDALRQLLHRLTARIDHLEQHANPGDLPDEKPPHY